MTTRPIHETPADRLATMDDPKDRGVWVVRTTIDGTQSSLVVWAAIPALIEDLAERKAARP